MSDINNSLVDSIRQANDFYNRYMSKQADYDTYVGVISNNSPDIAPDNYGVDDYLSSSYYTWQHNRQQSIMDSALGEYVMLDQDEQTLTGFKQYLSGNRSEENLDSYRRVIEGKLNDSSLNRTINMMLSRGQYDQVMKEIDKQLSDIDPSTGALSSNNIYSKKTNALEEAEEAKNSMDEYEAKINPYFKMKDESTDIDFTNIDTYLYKLPGLMGSSSATIGVDAATTAGALGASIIAGAVIGGPVGAAVGALVGGAISIAGNLYSRDTEAYMEVYSNYKASVQDTLQKNKNYDRILSDAKVVMRNSGLYTEDQINDDEYVFDQLLTNQIKLGDYTFNKAVDKNSRNLKGLYLDNMALSTVDIAQTMLEVMPFKFGKIGKVALEGVQAASKGAGKAAKAARTIGKLGKFRSALSKRIDDVTAYGLNKVEDLSAFTMRKAVRDLGGRMAVSSVLEGMEEGTQYIKGQTFLEEDFDPDKSIAERWFDNTLTGIRSLFAALTPWDPVYSDDKEFMENFKGGMLLGGIMTGGIGAVTGGISTYKQIQADALVSGLYADALDAKDRVHKSVVYGQAARTNSFNRIYTAFENLKALNIDGITEEDINEEMRHAATIRNLHSSNVMRGRAEKLHIDPRTEDYDIYIGLVDYHTNNYNSLVDKNNEMLQQLNDIQNNEEIDKYAETLATKLKEKGQEIDVQTIKQYLVSRSMLQAFDNLIANSKDQGAKLKQIMDNLNISTSRADVTRFSKILEDYKKEMQKSMDLSKILDVSYQAAGISQEELQVPSIHEELTRAQENYIAAQIGVRRAKQDLDDIESTEEKVVKDKIQKYKTAENNSEKFVQDLDDFFNGKDINRAVDNSEVIEPEPYTTPEGVTETTAQPTQEQSRQEDQPATEEVTPLNAPEGIIPEGRVNIEDTTQPNQSQQTDQSKEQERESEPTEEDIKTLNDFISSGYAKIDKRMRERYQGEEGQKRLSEIREQAKQLEEEQATAQKQQLQENNTPVNPAPVNDEPEAPIPPIRSEETKPAEVQDLTSLMGEWLGEDVARRMTEGSQQAQSEDVEPTTQPPTQEQPLTYNKSIDSYSHQAIYHLSERGTGKPKSFQGMEEYLNNDELAEVTTNPDFIAEVSGTAYIEVRPYRNPDTGQTEDAIYVIMPYKGKNYIAAIRTLEGLKSYLYGKRNNPIPYDVIYTILTNLQNLRDKVLRLNEQVKKNPNLQIVPVGITTTTGRYINEKNPDKSPKNRPLTESAHLTIKDPYEINPDNIRVGVTTGTRSGTPIVRFKNGILSAKGQQLGQPMWEIKVRRPDGQYDTKLVKLNYATFKNEPEVADLIIDLLLDESNSYVDKNGVDTGVTPMNLLTFLVNFGPQTAVNLDNPRLLPGQAERLLEKQFYKDMNNNLVIGNNVIPISDIISDQATRDKVKQYIMDNFHWALDEAGLNSAYLGGSMQSQVRDHRFGSMRSVLLGNVDKIVLIPGKLEFTLKDFGIVKNPDGSKSIDEYHPNGISELGWYIKQGILLTDISDRLKDANIYIQDVEIVDKSSRDLPKQVDREIKETVQQSTEDVLELPDASGKTVTVDINKLMSLLDGKKKGPNMVSEVTPVEGAAINEEDRMSPKQATDWLQKTLGITPEITQSVVDVTEAGQVVVGRVTEDSILLSELAPVGAEYHEAWHRVSQLLINPKKRKRLYDKYRKKNKVNLSDSQIDEIYAEDFRRFMLDEAQNYDFETKNWFRRIIDFIKLWARTGSYSLANIYNSINRAKYNGVQPSDENVARFRQIYEGDGPNMEILGYTFKTINTVKQLDDIVKSLTYAFFRVDFAGGHNINYSDLSAEKPKFDTLKLMLQAQAQRYPSPVMDEIIEKYDDIIVPIVSNNLKNLGIRTIDNVDITDIEEGAEGVNIGQHTIEGMNISIKDNAPAEVKFFFQTIPAYEIGPDGKPQAKIDPVTHWPQFVDSNIAWVNILKDLHGCRTLSNLISRITHLAKLGNPFYQALLVKFNELIAVKSISSNPREAMDAEALLTKINTVITSDINNFITVKVAQDKLDKSITFSVVDNGVDTKAIKYPRIWSQSLFVNSGLFKYDSEGKIISSSSAKSDLKKVIDNLNTLRAAFTNNRGILNIKGKNIDLHIDSNIEIAKQFIIKQLNALGIGIDVATLNNVLSSNDFSSTVANKYSALNNFVVNSNVFGGLPKLISTLQYIYNAIDSNGNLKQIKTVEGDIINPTSVWNDSGFVKYLANYYANTHATDGSLSTLGPDGNSYYMVSQNNFAKDRVDELVNDPELQRNLGAVVYNQGSILLDAVRNGNKNIGIETLINFKDTTSQDTGRDYFAITDREDYLAKLTLTLNDRLIFPTVADKKTYHTIKGLKLPHGAIRFSGNSEHPVIRYSDEALDILLGYCYDELNQIELCLRQIDDDPKHVKIVNGKEVHYNEDGTVNTDWLAPNRRIKNFHTPNKVTWVDKNKVEHTRTLEGNGARFLFLTGIYVGKRNEKGELITEFINFNDPMKSAKENLQTAKNYFFNMSRDTQKAFLSSLINRRVKKEIETAKNYGLISANENNSIWSLRNTLLDSKVVNDRKQRYAGLDPTNAEGYAVFDILADYTINSIISIQEVEKIFSGAPAYYKIKYDEDGIIDISVDKIKRLGSLTSTGLNNRLDFIQDPIESDEYTVAELKDHEIMDKQYDTLEQLFIRGNIKEYIQEAYGQEAWNEVKDLNNAQIAEKYPEEVRNAKISAKRDVIGYKRGVNVADAAVYISPKMAENLLRMRGIWSYDIKLAFDVLTNPETADRWESDPSLYAKANKVVLNAMKYMAFGTRFNEIPGLGIPYFNKMALFPLFKSVATGDIRKLYDRMTMPGNEIDMVLFDSAVKAGSNNPTKFYRQAKDSEIELKDGQTVLSAELQDRLENDQEFRPTDLDKLVTYKQKYKYLRQQLETNPHEHEIQMLGTQFVKVGLSNLRDEDMYGPEGNQVSGKFIKETIIDCLNRLSDIGRQKIQEQLFNEDGSVNVENLAKMLQNDARDSDANDNILSGLQTTDGELDMPLDAVSNNTWLESRFTSLLNKNIVDVNIPGGAFIQRSAFAMEATAQDVITEDMINDGKPLLMINEKDGSMDAVVSINLFKHIIPNYNKMTFKQARQWLIDHNIIGQNATANAIGYRIPTQSIASISALRFVDVFPEIMGDTIMLPEGFTKLTGSDFDIDKLYVSRYAYDKDGNIIRDESESGIINTMMDNYLRVLLTKENTSSLKLSIDVATDNVKAVLKDLEGSSANYHPEPFEVYTPTYQEERKAEYTGGKAGIGPFALNNAHHILTQLIKLQMNKNEFTEALGIVDMGRIFDQPTVATPRGGRILDWLSAMINAFVDIAKDPYITRLNVNAWTYNMVSFLLRAGKGKQTFYFMYQPILREMAQEVLKTKGKYGIDRTKTPSQLEQEAIDRVLDKYDPDKRYRKQFEKVNKDEAQMATVYAPLFEVTINEKGEETSLLRDMIKNPNEVRNHNQAQVMVYYAWKALKPYADSLANLVKYSKIDTKRTGKSFAEWQNYLDGMNRLLEDTNFGKGEVQRFYDETFVGHKTNNTLPFGISIFKNLLLRNTDAFANQKDVVLALLGRKGIADNGLINSIVRGMEAQIKSAFFNQYIKDNNIDVPGMFKGRFTMAKRINNFKEAIRRGDRPELSRFIDNYGNFTNDFLNFLLPNIENNEANPDSLDFIDTSELLNTDQAKANNLINYWRELIEDPNPQVSKLFKDLAVYAFITTGDNPTMNSFFQYLPNSYRKQIGYSQFIKQQLDTFANSSELNYKDKDDFFRNNWSNDKLVKPVLLTTQTGGSLTSITYKYFMPNVVAGLRSGKVAIRPINWILNTVDMQKYPIFPPYIKINDGNGNLPANWHLYTIIGFGAMPDENNRMQYYPVYGLISKKGYKHRGHTVTEYGVQTQFDFNREPEWNYNEAMNNLQQLSALGNDDLVWSNVYPITQLPTYQNSNYLYSTMDTVVEEETDAENVPLQEVDEPTEVARPVSQQTIDIRSNQIDINTISDRTADYGVVVDSNLKSNYSIWQQSNPNGIVAYRVNFNRFNTPEEANSGRIGNPFSVNSRGASTVQKFYNWLTTGNNYRESRATEEYRQAIINRILNTPEGSPILYYKELSRPSHATVIGYLVNNKQLLQSNQQIARFYQLSFNFEINNTGNTNNIWDKVYNFYVNQKGKYPELAQRVFQACKQVGIDLQWVYPDLNLTSSHTLGEWNTDTISVYLNRYYKDVIKDSNDVSLEDTVLHEAIHALTTYAIDNVDNMPEPVQNAVESIEGIYEILLDKEKDNYVKLDGMIIPNSNDYYGLTNPKEMIAELANSKFRAILRKHKLLDSIIESVKQLFSRLLNILGITQSSTLEDVLLDNLNTILNNFDIAVFNKYIRERTAQRWFRDNVNRVTFSRAHNEIYKKQLIQQLKDAPDDQISNINLYLADGDAETVYRAIGGSKGKNKPICIDFGGVFIPAILRSQKKTDRVWGDNTGSFKPLNPDQEVWELNIDTHPTIIPIQEYIKAGRHFPQLLDNMSNLREWAFTRAMRIIDTLDATDSKKQSYLDDFSKLVDNEQLTTTEQVDGVINKFICNL